MFDYDEWVKSELEYIENAKLDPCCHNCGNCYTEYGWDLCKVHGNTLEIMSDCCDDWRV